MNRISSRILFFFFIFLSFAAFAQQIPEPMNPPRAVNDFAAMLSPEQQARLEQKLRNFNDTSSAAIVVVTVNNTGGMDIARFNTALAHEWGVGRADVDNGLVLLVSEEDRRINIATGYGMEGAVPDALAKRIIEQQIKPRFREGNFYGGLDAATDTIIKLASGEFTAEEVAEEEGVPSAGAAVTAVLVMLFLIIFPILQIRRFRSRHFGNKRRPTSWLGMILLMLSMNRHEGRSYQDFNRGGGAFGSGGSGFGGGSGGGFGGFGGGGFGGGGASGSW